VFSALVDIRRDPPRLIFGGGELCIKSAPSAIMAALNGLLRAAQLSSAVNSIPTPPKKMRSSIAVCDTTGQPESAGLFKPRVHLAVRLRRSHMTMSGGSDKSIDGRGDSSDHRRQQRDWP
jgi:hypothetical protein